MSLSSWCDSLSLLASRITRNFEANHGYPPGTNELVRANEDSGRHAVDVLSAAGVQGELLDFYAQVERASFPDAGDGLFLHSAEDVAAGIQDGQPTKISGPLEINITVFGSDGGGSLFAISRDGKVYRLSSGALIGSLYDVEPSGIDQLAQDLSGFLTYFQSEVEESVPIRWA